MSRDALYEALKKYNIFSRRYFYPLLCDFPCYRSIAIKDPLMTARRVSERILCLPIYPDLAIEDVVRICEVISLIAKAIPGGRCPVRNDPCFRREASMKLATMQPYLFPYLGYFQLAASVDRWVFHDDCMYIKQGYIHRNYILVNGETIASPSRSGLSRNPV